MVVTEANPAGPAIMARAKAKVDRPMGPAIARNLLRLGYASIVPHATQLSSLVAAKTDKTMTRQRISLLMNAVNVEPATVATLAKAIGVKPEELLRE